MDGVQLRQEDLPQTRILLVDDEADLLDLFRMLLEPAGYVVDAAIDGRKALAAAMDGHYDIVVTDVTMPNMDGIALGRALRQHASTRNAMIVIHSALSEAWVRSLFTEFDLFLAKPEGTARLVAGIAQLIQKRREQTATDARLTDH